MTSHARKPRFDAIKTKSMNFWRERDSSTCFNLRSANDNLADIPMPPNIVASAWNISIKGSGFFNDSPLREMVGLDLTNS